MPRKTLYLIDGHAQIYRAYYAPFGALSSPTGEPTRAVHVFTQMVLNLLRDRRPDYLAMVMDVSDRTVFRVQIDPDYKANRDASPEDLGPQIERIVSILEAMRVPILRCEGFEADDLMATLCRRLAAADLEIVLVSKDKDLDQLLGDHVRMYDPHKDRDMDVQGLIEEKGYGPSQAVDAQMLMGDSTDNVKGVPGVGPKKAAQLLQKYGNLENILAHADEQTPKLRENLLAFRERMETVRRLVTLRDDVELDFDLGAAATKRFTPTAAAPILEELGLRRLLDRVGAAAGDADRPKQQAAPQPSKPAAESVETPSLFATAEAAAARRYELVDTAAALNDLAAMLARVEAFAFDTETTALVAADADLVGISVSFEAGSGYYLPVLGVGKTLDLAEVRRRLGPIFADPRIKKRGQNLKYDISILKSAGFDVQGIEFDSMIASFLLDPMRRSHGIDSLALELLDFRKIPTHDLIGKGKQQTTFDKLPTDKVCEYAAEDADIAWRLCELFERRLTDPQIRSLFAELEMPLVEVLAEMEQNGVALDCDLLARISGQMADRLRSLEHDIHEAAGHPFNINSTQQLADVLFNELGLRVVKRTKTSRSTDAEVLATLADESNHPLPKLILEHRELAKLKGTYVDALPEMVSRRTGRIHPSFHQTGAVTGRLSCSDPNLQNIPIRTDVGAQIRRAFVPGSPDNVLLSADYSQIELRVLAHFSGDAALRAAFAHDRDIHAFVAAQIAGIPIEKVTKEQRSSAKAVNFGIIYGQTAFGLARQTGMSQADAKKFIDRYFQRYPRIRGFLDGCIQHARDHGFVKTLLGRRRAIPDINSRNQAARSAAERFAANTVIQGTAADLIKKAMVNIHRRLENAKTSKRLDDETPKRQNVKTSKRQDPRTRMLIQVHDELVFEVPKARLHEDAKMIAHEMSTALPLDVPVKVDVSAGPNWLDTEPIKT